MSGHRAGTGAPVTRGMRVLLVVAAVLVFLAGLQLTVFPTRTAEWFSWTIDVPMTAVGLPLNEPWPHGRAAQSSAFLSTPGIERLYSGVTMMTPSASASACLKSRATWG